MNREFSFKAALEGEARLSLGYPMAARLMTSGEELK